MEVMYRKNADRLIETTQIDGYLCYMCFVFIVFNGVLRNLGVHIAVRVLFLKLKSYLLCLIKNSMVFHGLLDKIEALYPGV